MALKTIFEHDSAHAFLESLQHSRMPHRLAERTLESTRDKEEYLEIDEACATVVIAEIVATLRGSPHEGASKGILRGSIAKHKESLLRLHEFAIQAITRLQQSDNELRETADPIAFEKLINDLLARLSRPVDSDRAAKIIASKRQRVRPGDVFRIPLKNGLSGFGRMVGKRYFYVYSSVLPAESIPPIGSRDFLLYATGLYDEIGASECPIVGRDPLERNECPSPAVHNGPGALTTVWDLPHPFPNSVVASPYQCIGMEQLGSVTLDMLVARVESRESSVDQSLKVFGGALTASDIERGLSALAGRKTRLFDIEENQRFMLGIGSETRLPNHQ